MPRLLGSTLAGLGYAGRAAVRAYGDVKEIQRAGEREKRDQERMEWERENQRQRRLERARRNPVDDARSSLELEDLNTERAVRDAARGAYEEAPTEPLLGDETGGARPLSAVDGAPAPAEPRQMSAVRGPGASLAPGESGGVPDEAMPRMTFNPAYRQAAARAEAFRKAGQPEKATKVMSDFYAGQVAEREAQAKFDLLPRSLALRERGMTIDELKQNGAYRDVQMRLEQNRRVATGQLYGMLKAGDMDGAVRLFNASELLMPGQHADHFTTMSDPDSGESYVVAIGKDGQILKGQDGRPAILPEKILEREWRLANTTTTAVPASSRLVTTTTDEQGNRHSTVTLEPVDPQEARRQRNDDRRDAREREGTRQREDAAWAGAINRARDDSHRYLKDALGLTPNAMGQVMNPDNAPVFQRAQPIVERELQKLRDSGKRVDQVNAADIAERALKEARDQVTREKAGAGPRGGSTGGRSSSGSVRPTVRDIIGG